MAHQSEMTRNASSDTGLTYDWWSLARYLLTSLRFFVGGTLSFAAAVLAAVTLEALAALRFFVGVGGCVVGGCGVGGCVVGACEVGGGLFFGGACDSRWSYHFFISGAGRRNTGAWFGVEGCFWS